jgi:hypothetical protein
MRNSGGLASGNCVGSSASEGPPWASAQFATADATIKHSVKIDCDLAMGFYPLRDPASWRPSATDLL